MEGIFEKRLDEATLLDHTDNFREKRVPVEIRTDHFTGRVSRILKFRWKLPRSSHDPALIEASRENCPFCPQQRETATPRFPESLIPGGRLRHGRCVVIPNAFPYCRFCGVAIFCDDHYMPLGNITPEILLDALEAGRRFIRRTREHDGRIRFGSINWNYMPTAGGSLIHPHFQVVANPDPTHFHQTVLSASTRYRTANQRNFWSDLIDFEHRHRHRFLFCNEPVVFLASYSPGGIFGEVLAVFREITTLEEVTDGVRRAFIHGLSRVLRCFDRLNLDNLNMTLLLNLERDTDFWLQARIMPRIRIPPWGTNDVNYFEKGHDEVITVFSPEDLADEIRKQ